MPASSVRRERLAPLFERFSEEPEWSIPDRRGVPIDSAAPSAARATTNCVTVAAKACAIPAMLHNATPIPNPRRIPTRSMNQPVSRNAIAAANWKAEAMCA